MKKELAKEIAELLTNDSVFRLLRYGYKNPSGFVDDGDDCSAINRLYDISNELLWRKEANQ